MRGSPSGARRIASPGAPGPLPLAAACSCYITDTNRPTTPVLVLTSPKHTHTHIYIIYILLHIFYIKNKRKQKKKLEKHFLLDISLFLFELLFITKIINKNQFSLFQYFSFHQIFFFKFFSFPTGTLLENTHTHFTFSSPLFQFFLY